MNDIFEFIIQETPIWNYDILIKLPQWRLLCEIMPLWVEGEYPHSEWLCFHHQFCKESNPTEVT